MLSAPDGLWVVVPVKRFASAKSRLAAVLAEVDRAAHARAFCEHVLDEVAACEAVAGILVATNCDDVERLAASRGAAVLRDGEERALGAIVDRALAHVAARGARAAIVLMSDLPRLATRDVWALVRALEHHPVALAPDRSDEGTNALGLAPPDRFATCFGTRGSFLLHLERARGEAAEVAVVRADGLACDVDTPDDLARLGPLRVAGRALEVEPKAVVAREQLVAPEGPIGVGERVERVARLVARLDGAELA